MNKQQKEDLDGADNEEAVDVGQVVAELFKLEDEEEQEDLPQRSRRSHRNNFEEFDCGGDGEGQQSPKGGASVGVEDIQFSIDNTKPQSSNAQNQFSSSSYTKDAEKL